MSSLTALPNPPRDRISAVAFSPSQSSAGDLLVASWDGGVYIYDTDGETDEQEKSGPTTTDEVAVKGRLVGRIGHPAPVLAVVFGRPGEAFSASLDWVVRRIDLVNRTLTPISRHGQAVAALSYASQQDVLVSVSWDKTANIHSFSDDRTTIQTVQLALPDKPFAAAASLSKLVVAMAHRAVAIYDLDVLRTAVSHAPTNTMCESSFPDQSSENSRSDERVRPPDLIASPPNKIVVEPWQRRESSLRFMTRAVACTPADDGYATGSIEGRVAVEWFEPSTESQARKYAFKCHRQTQVVDGSDGQAGEEADVVFPVNALAFHPIHGTFASGGGDGAVAVWDGVAKRRIRQYHRFDRPVVAMDFDRLGRRLAIAVSPAFKDGDDEPPQGQSTDGVAVYIRELDDNEARPKRK